MKTLLTLLALIAVALAAAGQSVQRTNINPSVTLAWDAVSDPRLGGYRLYTGGAPGSYTNLLVIFGQGTTSVTLTNMLVRGDTYYFAVTSWVTNGLESVYSPEVSWLCPSNPPAPKAITITEP